MIKNIFKISFILILLGSCNITDDDNTKVRPGFFQFQTNEIDLSLVTKVQFSWMKLEKDSVSQGCEVFKVTPVKLSDGIHPSDTLNKGNWSFRFDSELANFKSFSHFQFILELPEVDLKMTYSDLKVKVEQVYKGKLYSLDSLSINGKCQPNIYKGMIFPIFK